MKKSLYAAPIVGAALIFAAGAWAQRSNDSKGDEDARRTSSTANSSPHSASNPSSGDAASPSRTTTGRVESYSADGKTMVVVTETNQRETVDLKGSVSIDPSIAVGSRVKITESRDTDGNRIVKVDPY